MSVKIRGTNKLLKELEQRLGKANVQRVSDAGLKKASKVFVDELISQFQSFKDTGASIEEITVSEPQWINGVRNVKVHWKGPKDRYRIIHLNEFGTIKNPNPDGKGAIARALRNSEKAYARVLREELRRGI